MPWRLYMNIDWYLICLLEDLWEFKEKDFGLLTEAWLFLEYIFVYEFASLGREDETYDQENQFENWSH
jgi:hypothetical protein